MDKLDKQIINQLQTDFPVCLCPYAVIARRLGISEDVLFDRVCRLTESGIIRRIGVSVDSRRIGFESTLAALRVKGDMVETASEVIDSYREITHSYLRADQFNIWFTVIAETRQRIRQVLEELAVKLEIDKDDVLDLPVKKLFKLDVRFRPAEYTDHAQGERLENYKKT